MGERLKTAIADEVAVTSAIAVLTLEFFAADELKPRLHSKAMGSMLEW